MTIKWSAKDSYKKRLSNLKKMHEFAMEDEEFYYEWIVLGVPDGDQWDNYYYAKEIAKNVKEYVEVCEFFDRLVKYYGYDK